MNNNSNMEYEDNIAEEDTLHEFYATGKDSAAAFMDLGIAGTQSQKAFEEGQKELLGFKLANEEYAIPISNIKTIIKFQPVTDVPRAPHYIMGIISLRGEIIPIYDLRIRLRLYARKPDRSSRILVVKNDIQNYGLLVDKVIHVVRFHDDEIEPPPPMFDGVEAEFVAGVGKVDERMWILLNLDSVIRSEVS